VKGSSEPLTTRIWPLLHKGCGEADCETLDVSGVQRVREIFQAMMSATFAARPKRRYDFVGEAIARPFGESAGRGAVRAGGVTDDEDESAKRSGVIEPVFPTPSSTAASTDSYGEVGPPHGRTGG